VLPSELIGGPLGTRLTVRSAPVFGGQLALRVAPGVALVGSVSGIRPFVQVGAGAVQRGLSVWEIEVSSTSNVFQAGAGIDLQIAPGLAVRLLVRDHVGRFDLREAVLVDLEGSTMHNVTLGVGLHLAF